MGEKRRTTAAFLKAHPLCCFCGGETAATTIDHQPARALFDGKVWPEGYEFPACYACNRASAHYENALALLVRINAGPETSETRRLEVQKYLVAMNNNFPDLIKVLSTPEKRKFLKQEGLKKPPHMTYSDLPMVGMESNLAENAIEFVMKKLFRALHYKHAQKVAPVGAGIFLRWYTNAYEHQMAEMKEFISALGGRPPIMRNKRDLSDQFFYLYGLDRSVDFSAFACFFRSSIAAVGLLAFDPDTLSKIEEAQ